MSGLVPIAQRERRTPVALRPSVLLAIAYAAAGLLLAAYLILDVFHYQDRRPPDVLANAAFAKPIVARDWFGEPEARITIIGGERSTYRAAGGTDSTHEWLELSIVIEAIQASTVDPFAWHASAAGEELHATVTTDIFGSLQPGQVATGRVWVSDIPTGATVTVTFKGTRDESPLLVMTFE